MPVIRNVETMNYADIEKNISDLGEKVKKKFSNIISLCQTFFRALWLINFGYAVGHSIVISLFFYCYFG